MPLRAIISDIHGNLEALQAVLEDIKQEGAGEIVCLGDIVGYGPDPVACVKIIRKTCLWSLCGNHDAALFMPHAVGFSPVAARALAWHRRKMRPSPLSLPGKRARWRWLKNLPQSRQEGNALYVHASPRDPIMEYVLEEDFKDIGFGASADAADMFNHFEWVCFVGHSHRPGIATHRLNWLKPADLPQQRYELPPDEKTIVNIGAVGQPRDKIKDACYVLFDGKSVRYRRVPYDVEKTMAKIAQCPELEPRLGERLGLGI